MKSNAHNMKTIKNDNRALVLNMIRKSPVSRADIAKRTALSKSSVTMIVNALISEGQVCETGTDEASVGRKPILLDIVPDYRFAIGIFIMRTTVKICLTDLRCGLLCRESAKMTDFDSADGIYDYAAGTAFRMIKEKKLDIKRCIGVGISCPGPLDHIAGRVLSPPGLPLLQNSYIADEIHKRTGMKVTLENNAVLIAMRENLMMGDRNVSNFISIIAHEGVGSAIVTGGEIYRGSGGYAGEIGHISVVPDGEECLCGNKGCLERYISLSVLRRKFGFEAYEELVDAAQTGDKKSLAALEYIAKNLGSALVTAINLFDLDAIILHGDFCYKQELLNKLLLGYIGNHSLVGRVHSVAILPSMISRENSPENSTAAIIEQYFDQNLEEI